MEKYQSELDAEIIHSNIHKNNLTDDPLLRYFKVGMNNEGYWTSSHAKLQLWDVFDCLTNIYPNFDFMFLCNQSSGHTKMREDILIPSNINEYGGVVSTMHDTNIHEIRPHTPTLHVGSKQKMNFEETDEGLFWLE